MRWLKAEVTPRQFALLRILLGLYLAVHFAALVPYGAELWSRAGVLPDPRLNPTHGLFPSPLAVWDTPGFVTAFLVALAVLALVFALGWCRRAAALLLWFGWACLFNRNNLIANPSIPYVGLLLLLTLLVPTGEPLALSLRRARRDDSDLPDPPGRRGPDPAWSFPASVYTVAWVLLAAGYTYSGWVKLGSPSWIDGSALRQILDNPLARPGPARDLALALPPGLLRLATWTALACELLALPLSLTRGGRRIAWIATGALQVGILTLVNFADLTFGMAMIHLFTLDRAWLPARRRSGVGQPERPDREATGPPAG